MLKTVRKWQHRVLSAIVRRNPEMGLHERAELFVEMFEKYLPAKSKILDIGGGWGFYHKPLTKRQHQHVVVDVVNPGVQNTPVVIYPGKRIPFEDKSFDVSLFITVLHHIHDVEKVIDEAWRVSKSKVIIVEDLYHHSFGRWWTVLRDQIYNFEFFGHPKNFKKKHEWIELFENRGFSFIEASDVVTELAGLKILNGVFVFEVKKK